MSVSLTLETVFPFTVTTPGFHVHSMMKFVAALTLLFLSL